MITAKRLKQILHYDPETGIWTRIVKTNRNIIAGKVAGTIGSYGYRIISLDYEQYRSARLAWFYVYGKWPRGQIDHVNGDRLDDRIKNLRDVSVRVNRQNMRECTGRSTTGFLGVERSHGKFLARLTVDGNRHYLGRFDTPQEAHEVYVSAKRKLHEGCAI